MTVPRLTQQRESQDKDSWLPAYKKDTKKNDRQGKEVSPMTLDCLNLGETEWRAAVDGPSGKKYYWNIKTLETRFEEPDDIDTKRKESLHWCQVQQCWCIRAEDGSLVPAFDSELRARWPEVMAKFHDGTLRSEGTGNPDCEAERAIEAFKAELDTLFAAELSPASEGWAPFFSRASVNGWLRDIGSWPLTARWAEVREMLHDEGAGSLLPPLPKRFSELPPAVQAWLTGNWDMARAAFPYGKGTCNPDSAADRAIQAFKSNPSSVPLTPEVSSVPLAAEAPTLDRLDSLESELGSEQFADESRNSLSSHDHPYTLDLVKYTNRKGIQCDVGERELQITILSSPSSSDPKGHGEIRQDGDVLKFSYYCFGEGKPFQCEDANGCGFILTQVRDLDDHLTGFTMIFPSIPELLAEFQVKLDKLPPMTFSPKVLHFEWGMKHLQVPSEEKKVESLPLYSRAFGLAPHLQKSWTSLR